MSLRDFNSSSEDRPIILNNEPMGNGAGLGAFHTVNPEDREPNNTPKIIGALAVALMVGAAGAYVYSVSGKSMQPAAVQTASNIPTPAPLPPAPQPVADTTAPAPTADATTAMSPPAPAPAPEVKSASTKPVSTKRTASADLGASSARMAADTSQPVTSAPQQTAAIPEPVSPTASPSDIASNAPVSQPTAAPTAVTPTVEQAPAPTPEQPAATPAPAAEPAPAPVQ